MVVKSVEVDLSVTGDVESKAKLDALDARAEALKKAFPTYALKVDSATAQAKLAVFRADLKSVADAAAKPVEVQLLSAKAVKTLEDIRLRADKLRLTFPTMTAKIDDREFAAKLAVMAAEAKITGDLIDRDLSGAGGPGGIPGFGGGASGASPAASAAPTGLANPYVAAGAAAAVLTTLPFLAQAAATSITIGLGGALAGLGILGAAKTKSVITSFDDLKTHATKDLTDIGASFVPVLNNILKDATTTLGKLTPVFAAAEKTISGPFQVFSDALIKTFASPAVKTSIDAVAKAFGAILTSITPSLAGDVNNIAIGVTNIAKAVSENPHAVADFVSDLTKIAGGALNIISSLTRVANWIESNWNVVKWIVAPVDEAISEVVAHWHTLSTDTSAVFTTIKNGIISAWNTIWTSTKSSVTTGVASVVGFYTGLVSKIGTAMSAVRSGIASAWATIWTSTKNTVTAGVSAIVGFFQGLPGKVTSALSSLGSTLLNIGKGAMSSLLSGFTSVAGSILSWLGNFAKSILNAIASPFGIHFSEPSVSTTFHKVGAQIMQGLINGIESKVTAAVSHATAAANAVTGAMGSAGVSNASGVAALKSAAAKHGWTSAAEWAALNNVEMREAGYSLTATNPSSGAYGMAQFINGASEYAQYGGNSTTYAGQATAMANYIAQRYGDPIAAWAHEQAYGWYGSGLDAMFSRPTLIGVGERGPERVQVTPGHGGGGMSAGEQAIVAALADMSRRIDNLTGVTASVPRATGQHVGAAIGGAAADASFRRRYG